MSEKSNEEQTAESVASTILELANRDDEVESLKRHLVFSIGISVGLILALHLILRREL